MKKLFFVPFAFGQKQATGMNVKKDPLNTYLKNICVALISAKQSTPEMDVALVCNIDVPDLYRKLLLDNNVLIFKEPFDSFVFSDDYPWCLAYYKLCALEKVLKYEYDFYLYTDADVYVQSSLENVFEELKDNILLYDINHGLGVRDYRIIDREFRQFGVKQYITHFGGEFFGASASNAQRFIEHCKAIYEKMQAENFVTTKGDEFILSVAASEMRDTVKNAGAYISRFWTGLFYLVSSCYRFNEVAILHMPREKNVGILKLFDIFVKKGRFPKKQKVHRICHLTHMPVRFRVIASLKSARAWLMEKRSVKK